ncbi:MAG: DUF6508 domain-containing protein [Coriobacteriia bacterium]|nr:DUF6508 domain-containing protein [Coriobacteriia bacterium]
MTRSDESPPPPNLTGFSDYADAFELRGFVAGRAHPSEELEPGVYSWPSWESSPIVSEWHRALYDHNIIDPQSPYLTEEFAARMREFEDDPSLLSGQDLSTIRTVLTYISRGERFCDGLMADMFDKGVAQSATRRLVELGRTPK